MVYLQVQLLRLNCAQKTWQKCSIIKSIILDADQKAILLNPKIKFHAQLLFLALTSLVMISCSSTKLLPLAPTLHFINSIEIRLTNRSKTRWWVVLSVLIMMLKLDLYYFICDDRSVYNDARFIPLKNTVDTDTLKNVLLKM
jgi:hypothetical protein